MGFFDFLSGRRKNENPRKRLLLEKLREINIREVDARYRTFRRGMIDALQEYSDNFFLFFGGKNDLVQRTKLALEIATAEKIKPFTKNDIMFKKMELSEDEQYYLDTLHEVVDIANEYLISGEVEEKVLLSLREVLRHFCYGDSK